MYGRLRTWSLFLLINFAGIALLALAYMKGWVNLVIERDATRITLVIPVLFFGGLFLCVSRIFSLNRAFNHLAKREGRWIERYRQIAAKSISNASELLQVSLFRKLMWLRYLQRLFPILGMVGTVMGFMIATDGSKLEGIAENQAMGMQLVVQMIQGIGIALTTTLVGMIFMVWMSVNLRLLETESMRLTEQVLEAGLIPAEDSAEPEPKPETPSEPSPQADSEPKGGDESATS
ncbi:MAG: MotA/TolQ/ExbB proton channel family protein [Bdellovibrionales bacterium]|nr:MotA/TolQ/ExbB proton channel family protein [Bdellovibrionales bacterium]